MRGGGARVWRWPILDDDTESDSGFEPAALGRDREPDPGHEEAERVLAERRQRAEQLLEQARNQAEQIRHDAREQAWAEALADARKRLQEALEDSVAEQTRAFERARQKLLEQITAAAAERMEQLEQELTGLIAAMAEKVIHRKVEAEDGVVLDVIRATIEQAAGAGRFTVRVAAPEEELVRAATAELLAAADGAQELEVVADESIGPGGCIVETERGRFDARIETQIDLLTREIGRVIGEGEGI